jgi:hypothetical protein
LERIYRVSRGEALVAALDMIDICNKHHVQVGFKVLDAETVQILIVVRDTTISAGDQNKVCIQMFDELERLLLPNKPRILGDSGRFNLN